MKNLNAWGLILAGATALVAGIPLVVTGCSSTSAQAQDAGPARDAAADVHQDTTALADSAPPVDSTLVDTQLDTATPDTSPPADTSVPDGGEDVTTDASSDADSGSSRRPLL